MSAIAASVVSGLLYAALFPPLGAGALCFVALVPLLLALQATRSLRAALGCAALFALVATAAVIPWLAFTLHEHFGKGWPLSLAFWLFVSAAALVPYYAPLLALAAASARRLPPLWTPLLFAAAWVAAEWLRTQLGLRSSWTRLGDALVDARALRQVADLAGVYGLSFLVVLVNASIAALLQAAWQQARERRPQWRPVGVMGAASLLLLGLCWRYGEARLDALAAPELRGRGLEVALVQGNVEPERRWRRSRAGLVLRRYGGLTRDLFLDGDERGAPELVVWPENAIQTQVDDPVYGPPLRRLAARAPILLGAPRSEPHPEGRRAFNSAFLVTHEGVDGHYDKRRLLAFSETRPLAALASLGARGDLDAAEYTPGSGPALFALRGGQRVAPLICLEALYPALAREAALAGATLLANLSNDGWFGGHGGSEQHLAMVRFRAIETRRPLLRATTTGITAVIAADGAVVGALARDVRGVLRASVPPGPAELSLYSRLGDLLPLACLVGLAGGALLAQTRSGVGSSMPPRSSA